MSENENNNYDVFENDPEYAAISAMLDLEYMIRHQSEDDQIKTMLTIAVVMTDKIISTGKYTLDEVMNEISKKQGQDELKRILARMREEEKE